MATKNIAAIKAATKEVKAARKNFFAVKPIAPKGAAAKAKDFTEVEGLESYTAFDVVGKAAGALKDADGVALKPELIAGFIAEGCELGKQPENYHGKEGAAEASIQMRRKTVKSPLDALQLKAIENAKVKDAKGRLVAANIPVQKINATFEVNEKYMGNIKMMETLNALLADSEFPEDLFVQNSEERHVVTDETITAIFKTGDEDLAAKLIPMVAQITIVPKWKGDFADALKLSLKSLQNYEGEGGEVVKAVAGTKAAPKVQHLNVAKAAAKPAQITVTKSAAKPVAASKAKPVKLNIKPRIAKAKVVTEDLPDRIVMIKGSASQTFKKGDLVWANFGDGYAYQARVLGAGNATAKIKYLMDDVTVDNVEFKDMLPIFTDEEVAA